MITIRPCLTTPFRFHEPAAAFAAGEGLLHGFAPGHHSTGEWSRLSDLTIKEARFVEVLYCCAGPISCRAGCGVAIAAQRNPFFGS